MAKVSSGVALLAALLTLSPLPQRATPTRRAPTKPTATGCSPSATTLRALTRQLRTQQADDNEFIRALDAAIKGDAPRLEIEAPLVVRSDSLYVLIMFPYTTYRLGLIQAMRMKEPLEKVEIPSAVTVAVSPSKMDSPDIVKILVERDGKVVPPLANLLKPTAHENAFGAKITLHAGMVLYPCSAFAPGAEVTVTAMPAIGSNWSLTLSSDALAALK